MWGKDNKGRYRQKETFCLKENQKSIIAVGVNHSIFFVAQEDSVKVYSPMHEELYILTFSPIACHSRECPKIRNKCRECGKYSKCSKCKSENQFCENRIENIYVDKRRSTLIVTLSHATYDEKDAHRRESIKQSKNLQILVWSLIGRPNSVVKLFNNTQ